MMMMVGGWLVVGVVAFHFGIRYGCANTGENKYTCKTCRK